MRRRRLLKKSKRVLIHAYRLLQRSQTPSSSEHQAFREKLRALQDSIIEKDAEKAYGLSQEVHTSAKSVKKSFFHQLKDLVGALVFALIVAFAVRQMWFEFYEIPTGSMRPTLREKDRLMVSKTEFGINVPFSMQNFYFDSHLVKRSGIFVFTGENMDIRDVNTVYFYLFPGKKQYVKRMIGKPGDTLYFYGGKIYGIDAQGVDISHEFNPPELEHIDHVPFIYFDGKTIVPSAPEAGIYRTALFYQMNQPFARLSWSPYAEMRGEMLVPHAPASVRNADYGDFWGINNYATARLLTKEEVRSLTDTNPDMLPEGQLYLELRHHPSFKGAHLALDERGRFRPTLGLSTSILPLNAAELKTLFQNLYTSRFYVKNGVAYRYGLKPSSLSQRSLPRLPGIPDGCYEIFQGKAYSVGWQGINRELPPKHPLRQFDITRLTTLFNLGIEWDTHFAPQAKDQPWHPSRFAYFRNGSLYVMGAPLLMKEEATLNAFLEREKSKMGSAPFIDNGPPLVSNGQLDRDTILSFGIRIPEKSYLALGDNYANSADSRDFGFVPQGNIRGAPEFIFWPPGERFGHPNQPSYAFFTLPRLCIWALAALLIGIGWFVHYRRTCLPLKGL